MTDFPALLDELIRATLREGLTASMVETDAARAAVLAYVADLERWGKQHFDQAMANGAEAARLRGALMKIAVGGCTCETKTPNLEWHDERCHYRIAEQAIIGAGP